MKRDIFSIIVPRSGVRHSALYEWRDAAHWAYYTWEAFCKLDGEEQSAIVAHYRCHHQIEAVFAEQYVRDSKRNKH